MTLHQICGFNPAIIEQMLAACSATDEFLFIGDGLSLLNLWQGTARYRISDAESRGIQSSLPAAAIGLNDKEWVELTLTYDRVITWH